MGTASAQYVGGQVSSRFAQTDAPPRPATALEELRSRLAGTLERAQGLTNRLYSAADRATGPAPSAGVAVNGNKSPQPMGTVAECFALLEEIGRALETAHEQAARLESVA